jgi:hypothetical protein
MGMSDPFEALRRYQQLHDSLISPHARLTEQLISRNYALESLLAQQHRLDELTANAVYSSSVTLVAAEQERARELLRTAYDSRLWEELRGTQTQFNGMFEQATGIDRVRLAALTENYSTQLTRAAGFDAFDDIRKHVAAMSAIIPTVAGDPLISEILANIVTTRLTLSDHISGLREVFPCGLVDRIEATMLRQARLFESYSASVLPTLSDLPKRIAVTVRGRVTTSSRALKSSAEVVEYLDDETDDEGDCKPDAAVLQLLREFDKALVGQYLGALAASNRRGPDSARQVAISLRELLKFVVEGAAPTGMVIDWLTAQGHVRAKSRPTDRDRLSYIWRGHRQDEMVLVTAHIGTIVALRIALSAPTHAKDFNAPAMRAYIRSLEAALLLILPSWKDS